MAIQPRTIWPLLSILCLFTATLVPAQPPKEPDGSIEQLAWAVGGKWVAELKGADGGPLTAETTFEWAGHRKSIKYVVQFKTAEKTTSEYEGTYYWNPEKKQLALLQIDRKGNVTEALLTVKGDQFKQENALILADGTRRQVRAEFTREGDDVFAFKAFVLNGEEWVEAVAIKYKRVR